MKLQYLILLLLVAGCSTRQVAMADKSCQECAIVEIATDDNGEFFYQLPKGLVLLPIDVFTWYPDQISTLSPLIKNAGETGQFVWLENCLLFKTKTDELITPIFWVNSIKGYHDKNGEHALIRHDDKEIALNAPYHIDVNPEPKQNNRTDWIVQRGKDKCLMDKVVYLPSSVVDGV